MQGQIEDSAYLEAKRQSTGESVVVGVNKYETEDTEPVPVLEVDPELEQGQKAALEERRSARDQSAVDDALSEIGAVAATDENLMPSMKEALKLGATVGEVSDALREVFGLHRPSG